MKLGDSGEAFFVHQVKDESEVSTFGSARKEFLSMVNVLKYQTLVACKKGPRQTVQTQIRLLLKKQSDQGLFCLLF